MTEHKTLAFPLSVKSVDDAGTFEGLLSVYGNVDLGGDIVERGAFQKIETTPDGSIRILDGHDARAPVGKGKLIDTPSGLFLKGTLDLGVQRARELLSLMKQQIISGLSIGYDILPDGSETRPDGVRLLKKLRLWEASLVVFPMNPAAQITSVKAVDGYKSIADLEAAMRREGYSKRKARVCALHNWSILKGAEPEAGFAEMIEEFNSISPER